jgi:hypothetical protein
MEDMGNKVGHMLNPEQAVAERYKGKTTPQKKRQPLTGSRRNIPGGTPNNILWRAAR